MFTRLRSPTDASHNSILQAYTGAGETLNGGLLLALEAPPPDLHS